MKSCNRSMMKAFIALLFFAILNSTFIHLTWSSCHELNWLKQWHFHIYMCRGLVGKIILSHMTWKRSQNFWASSPRVNEWDFDSDRTLNGGSLFWLKKKQEIKHKSFWIFFKAFVSVSSTFMFVWWHEWWKLFFMSPYKRVLLGFITQPLFISHFD